MKSPLSRIARSTPSLITLFVVLALGAFATTYVVSNSKRASAGAICNGNCVYLDTDKATTDTITTTPGSFVQFTSADNKPHSLSLGSGGSQHEHKGSFSSGNIKADEAWRVKFDKDGSYVFHDHYNPKISILVVVYTPGKTYKVEN